MFDIDWNEDKNRLLKESRSVCFEDVVLAMFEERVIANIPHYRQDKYDNQWLLIIEINMYAYVVPYIKEKSKMFLKTIYPSRVATKKYLN